MPIRRLCLPRRDAHHRDVEGGQQGHFHCQGEGARNCRAGCCCSYSGVIGNMRMFHFHLLLSKLCLRCIACNAIASSGCSVEVLHDRRADTRQQTVSLFCNFNRTVECRVEPKLCAFVKPLARDTAIMDSWSPMTGKRAEQG